ncbi:uncharacterized protein [Leptinotarsa decemlineata]|uniref:uncharacterized protein n=1 Tax=Leptinotarsa decemlineata TaxID=7539 RepID=UPI003D307F3A
MWKQLSGIHSDLIEEIGHQNGFTNFAIDIKPGSAKGDNYLGLIRKLTIKSHERKFDLILKTPASSRNQKNAVPIHKIFLREIYVYEKLFKEFKKFQNVYRISSPFLGYPRFYGKCDRIGNECVVLENIVEEGYKMWDRKKPMNAGHISAVLVEYAKFHAISLALQYKNSYFYEELTKEVETPISVSNLENREKTEQFVKSIIDCGCKALADDTEAVKKLRSFENLMPNYIMKDMRDPNLAIVITHGDNWCTNLMFKYEKTTNTEVPSGVCILDWQLSKKDSPAADLACFFLMHSPKEILYDYKKYLNLYHDTVRKYLRDFACDPEEIFPFSLLERHWKVFVKFGFLFSMLGIKVMYRDSDEIVEMDQDYLQTISRDIRKSKEYKQRIKDLLEFMTDNGFI